MKTAILISAGLWVGTLVKLNDAGLALAALSSGWWVLLYSPVLIVPGLASDSKSASWIFGPEFPGLVIVPATFLVVCGLVGVAFGALSLTGAVLVTTPAVQFGIGRAVYRRFRRRHGRKPKYLAPPTLNPILDLRFLARAGSVKRADRIYAVLVSLAAILPAFAASALDT